MKLLDKVKNGLITQNEVDEPDHSVLKIFNSIS